MGMVEKPVKLEDYEPLVGPETVDRVFRKIDRIKHLHIVHVNSTYYGGGVAELLDSLTLLLNSSGLKTGWRVIQGNPDFFSVTKKMHNGLQGGDIRLTDKKKKIYENVTYQNCLRNHLDHDLVVIHDPQPLPMIKHYHRAGPWVWVCHVNLSRPDRELWSYLSGYINLFDAVVFSLKEYQKKVSPPQFYISPAIDPFVLKNKELSDEEIDERLKRYDIPADLPLVVQISRFDKWKDPQGVIDAFKIARREVDATLVLLGNVATDDPEGEEVYDALRRAREERIVILSRQDTALVNALQRRAGAVLQKSISEGFGLTVTEAMWKGQAVIGGDTGGIRRQITDGENGFLVSSVEEAADRMVTLIKDERLRKKMGARAKDSVRKNYLMIRYLEQYLDLFASFETNYRIKLVPGANLEYQQGGNQG